MQLDWQTGAVVVIELLAVAYLIRKLVLPSRAPRASKRPDVAASALVRKK